MLRKYSLEIRIKSISVIERNRSSQFLVQSYKLPTQIKFVRYTIFQNSQHRLIINYKIIMRIFLLTIFLSLLLPTTYQAISISIQVPAHVYRIECYPGDLISITLSWTSNYWSTNYLSMCLLKGGQYFNSTNCLGTTQTYSSSYSQVSSNYAKILKTVPDKNVYFVRIDSTSTSSQLKSQIIKYNISIELTGNYGYQSESYVAGFDSTNRNKFIRYFQASISEKKYQQVQVLGHKTSRGLQGSFQFFQAFQMAEDFLFNIIFDGPGDMVSQFTQVSKQQKCFINIAQEIGMFILTIILQEITILGVLSDVAVIALLIADDQNCGNNHLNQAGIIGGSIGSVVFVVGVCFCMCNMCKKSKK